MADQDSPGQARQQEIDFSEYGWRRRVLRDVRLPQLAANDGSPVSKRTALLVLLTLESHAGPKGIYPSIDLLAAECQGLNEKTVRRAVQALAGIGVLAVQRRKIGDGRKTLNHYAIVWSELALLCPARANPNIKRTFSPDQTDILSVSNGHLVSGKAIGSHRKPPPNPPSGTDEAWLEAVDFFRKELYAVDRVAAAYRAASKSPQDFRQDVADALAIASLPEYAGRITSRAGAVVRFLERGLWPVDGMPDLDEYRRRAVARAELAAEARRQREREAERKQLIERERIERLSQRQREGITA